MYSGVEHLQLWLQSGKTSQAVGKSFENESSEFKIKTLFLNIFINSLPLEFYTVTLLSKYFSSNILV